MDYDEYDEDYDEDEAFITDNKRRRKVRRVKNAASPYQPQPPSSGNNMLRYIGLALVLAFIFVIAKSNGNDNSKDIENGGGNLRDPSQSTKVNQNVWDGNDDRTYPDNDDDDSKEYDGDDDTVDDDDDVDDEEYDDDDDDNSKEYDDDDTAQEDGGDDDVDDGDDDEEYDDDDVDDDEEYDDDDDDDDDDEEYDDDDDTTQEDGDDDTADGGGDDDDVNEYNDDDDTNDDGDDDNALDDDDTADGDDDEVVDDDETLDEGDDDDVEVTDDDDAGDDGDVGINDDDETRDDDDTADGDDDEVVDDDEALDEDDDKVDIADDDNNEQQDDDVIYDDDDIDDDDGDDDDTPSSPSENSKESASSEYHIRDEIREKFHAWDNKLRQIVEMDKYQGGEPKVNWDWHPKKRENRFPSVEERIKHYMGEWYNQSIPLYGEEFRKKTFSYQKTTRECDLCSRLAVNIFDLDPEKILDMYASGNPHYHIGGDFVDFAILHEEGSTQAIMNWGDNIPKVKYEADGMYPIYCKVRHYCEKKEGWGDYENTLCNTDQMRTIIWPVNHKRLHSLPFITADNDIPWEEKIPKAMWRGGAPEGGAPDDDFEFDPMETRHIKWKLISQFANSTLIDAKYTRRDYKKLVKSESFPLEYIAPRTEMDEQLKYKYLIAIEGNDVSSAIKWFLFSNSLVLAPPFRFDSWSMEGLLEPYVHYLPIKVDMSDVEEKVEWAESNPEEARKISERGTLFIYDLLMHPDAVRDNQLVLEGMMERVERNFGYSSSMALIHPLLHIHSSWHPAKREDRFPSLDTRRKYYMGIWHDENKPSMKRSTLSDKKDLMEGDEKLTMDTAMIASGSLLTECARGKDDSQLDLRAFCEDALPDFDERNEKEIKKKVTLIDDSIKVIQFGEASVDSDDIPIFGKARAASEDHSGGRGILWPFDYKKEFGLVESGLVEECETPFASKTPKAIWRGGVGTKGQKSKSNEYKNRVKLVRKSVSESSAQLDAKFLTTKEHFESKSDPKNFPREGLALEPTDKIQNNALMKNILSYRYIIATEDDYRINSDLKWMLLSQSVVFMAKERRFSSWFMEDFLEPYVHYVPIERDYSDVEEKLKWCEENIEEVEKISERATLFVHDMLFHFSSDREFSELKFQLMEKYAENFG